ncbi:MAG: protein translocase subunit SecDF [Crocinitomicaceae bacterium]|nr:protein translocase subunit SecDF [Crocinitomicaceae bacterium]
MRNKGFFWSITIALALACIYQLSFKWATNRVENKAIEYGLEKVDSLVANNVPSFIAGKDTLTVADPIDQDQIADFFRQKYLADISNESVHLGYTYSECKENELNFGLDLQGGMSVTLEISVPELVDKLAGNTRNPEFRKPFESALTRTANGEGDFIDMFQEEYEKMFPQGAMAKIFHPHNQENIQPNNTNDEVIDFLKKQADGALDGVEVIIEKRVNAFGVSQPTIQKQTGSNRIYVELPGVVDRETVRKRLQATANLEFFEVYDNAYDGIGNKILEAEKKFADFLSTEKTDTPVILDSAALANDSSAVSNDSLQVATDGDSTETDLLSEAESTDTAASADMTDAERDQKYPITSKLTPSFSYDNQNQPVGFSEGPVVGFASVGDTALINSRIAHPEFSKYMPEDLVFMWEAKEMMDENKIEIGLIRLYAIKVPEGGAQVDGEDIDESSYSTNPQNPSEVRVTMRMTQLGADKWAEMTGNNVGKSVAITMDRMVYSAPVVQEKMTEGISEITGPTIDLKEAKELSGLLNAGALPAPARIIDESVVEASLGEANITAGFTSFVVAFLLVLVYMVFYYGRAGLIANVALIVNIFFLIGALASLKAILTLPGIAGIVLTIGMAVDANVLIFERVREEMRLGKGLKNAVSEGFKRALSSILDGNITTLLTGIVLASFGTGPIKGFATTLIIGIFTSMFAALVVTRLIMVFFMDRDKNINFSTKITEKWFTKINFPFVAKRKLFYLISGAVITIGLISMFTRGLDLGVDFQGGRQYKVEFEGEANPEAVATSLTDEFEGAPIVKRVDNKRTVLITTTYRITESSDTVNSEVEELVKTGLAEFGPSNIVESKMIAPTISKDLRSNSVYAVVFSLLIIFLYILLRFRKWQYGLGATLSLAHDVLIVLGLFSIFWGVLPFSLEIDQAFIAAILTVVGYSINDTVVVFDRVREYLGMYPKKDEKETINMAVNSTLGRTINTSMTTFIVLLAMFIMGGEAIKGFIFAIMIGVVVGTYSSICIATPTVLDFGKKKNVHEVK